MPTPTRIARSGGRARTGNLYSADCPSRSVLNHVTSQWGSLILVVLLEGTYRFSELARRIGGVSEKMLAQSLQALEADGLVLRTVYPTVPPKVEYSLTALGREGAVHMRSLATWVEANVSTILRIRDKPKRKSISKSAEKSVESTLTSATLKLK